MPALSNPAPGIDRVRIVKAAASLGILGSHAHGAPRVMAALCNPAVSAENVATLVRREPALYARVLKVANSPFYGQSRSVTSLERAVVLLGAQAITGIVAAACLDHGLARGRRNASVDLDALLTRSVATAAAAESLARIRHPTLAADAFIAGLLHDLGVLVQAELDPTGMQRLNDLRHAADPRPVRGLESEAGLIGHEACIAVVFEEWGLPETLVAAVRDHHEPWQAAEPHRILACLVHTGEALSHRLVGAPAAGAELSAGDRRAASWLDLNDEDLERVATALPLSVAQLQSGLLAA